MASINLSPYKLGARIGRGMLCLSLLVSGCGRNGSKTTTTRLSDLEQGIEKINAGDFQSAIPILEKVAAKGKDSDKAAAHCNLGLAHWKLEEFDAAVENLEKAVELAAADSRPLEFLAQLHLQTGDGTLARAALDRAVAAGFVSPRILTLQAIVELRSGNVPLAITLLEQAVEGDADYAPALYNLSWIYRENLKDQARASGYLERYSKIAGKGKGQRVLEKVAIPSPKPPEAPAPTPPPAKPAVVQEKPVEKKPAVPASPTVPTPPDVLQARTAIKAEAFDEALVLLNRAANQQKPHPDALWELAVLYDKPLGMKTKADAAYARFRTLFPQDPRAQVQETKPRTTVPPQPQTTARKTDSAPAIKPPRPAGAGAQPPRVQEAFNKAVKLHNAGQLDAAIAQYREALAGDSRFAEAHYNLGLACKKKGDLPAAAAAFSSALEAQPDMAKSVYMLAVVQREQGDTGKAVAGLNKALRLQPDYAAAHLLLGIIYKDENRPDMAKIHFERYLHLAPDGTSATNVKKWLEQYRKPNP